MLEYIFFDPSLRDNFLQFLRDKGVAAESSDEGGFIALVPEDLDDALGDAIDLEYEKALQANAELLEETDDALEKSIAGIRVELSDGTPCQIPFDPDLLSRVLECISMEELRDMVQHIARRVEDPDDRPICHFT